jgi:hypothetical protein
VACDIQAIADEPRERCRHMKGRARVMFNVAACAALGCVQDAVLVYLWNFIPLNPATQWLIHQLAGTAWLRPLLLAQDLVINVILCLPLAAILCRLRPPLLLSYTASAVLPAFVWSNSGLVGGPSWSLIWPAVLAGWVVQLLMVPLAVLLLRRYLGPEPPDRGPHSNTA